MLTAIPATLPSAELDLSRVESGTHGQIQRSDAFDNRLRAANGAGGAVEGGEEAVARRIDLAPVEAGDLTANSGVMLLHEIPPATVSDRRCTLGRSDEIREEDRREHAVGSTRLTLSGEELADLGDRLVRIEPGHVLVTRKLDVPRARDRPSEEARVSTWQTWSPAAWITSVGTLIVGAT